MNHAPDFADVLQQFVNRSSYSAGQLARLTGIPKPTILSWLDGRVKHPRSYSDLLRLAESLHLELTEIIYLLAAAGFAEAADRLKEAPPPNHTSLKTAVAAAPFQAIPALPYFVGRHGLIKQIEEILLSDPTSRTCCLQGMAGVGKTALAAQMAYRLRPHFPDGVLWANLHRSDPMTVLSAFAHAYGQDVSRYKDLDSRSQMVRQLLADKRLLIILDDVWHGQDITPLLPPSTGETAVLITTRRHDLFATAGMHRLDVPPFDTAGQVALRLFGHFFDEQTIIEHEQTFCQIADLLGHLPLAVAIAASRMAYEPSWSPHEFLERLLHTQQQLSELVFEDQSVQISFSASFGMLGEPLQRFFALIGVFGGRDFTPEAAAAVSQTSLQQAEDSLRKLYALSLCQLASSTPGQTRYRLHPLLSRYAEETAVSRDYLTQAQLRLINFYIDYGEKHHDNTRLLTTEISNIRAVLQLTKTYDLPDAYRRGTAVFASVLK
ncbi:MAG: hypothetical protein H6657_15805 [Ardenticatenaceae bacterium]|nr:hypothetical protein [Ardenticatenaceae bacterium]